MLSEIAMFVWKGWLGKAVLATFAGVFHSNPTDDGHSAGSWTADSLITADSEGLRTADQ